VKTTYSVEYQTSLPNEYSAAKMGKDTFALVVRRLDEFSSHIGQLMYCDCLGKHHLPGSGMWTSGPESFIVKDVDVKIIVSPK
jgi:hypothetical protein